MYHIKRLLGNHLRIMQAASHTGVRTMENGECGIIVGVLGQWASGITLAAKTLIEYLGGKD